MPAAIHHYVQRAFRRPTARFPLEGAVVCEEDRVCAAFALECRDGHVAAVAYRSSSCATLLALCEYLAETLPGSTLDRVAALTAGDLLAAHPGIPPSRHSRAALAVRALQAALSST